MSLLVLKLQKHVLDISITNFLPSEMDEFAKDFGIKGIS